MISSFNSCSDARDKEQAIVNWLRKYDVDNFGTPTAFTGKITLLGQPEVTFGKLTIMFYSK